MADGRRRRIRVTVDPAYVTLALTAGVGAVRLEVLLRAFGSAEAALGAPVGELTSLPSMTRPVARAVASAPRQTGSEVIRRTAELGGVVLTPQDPRFPSSLREIPDPPPLLFAQGDLAILGNSAVAIVGSRDHTPYGNRVTRSLSRGCARAGLTVISGMARGLDAVAHEAALDVGGPTIGVLGNGLAVVYPSSNRTLYRRMREAGCLLTEFPPEERPTAGSFPRRNRIISGLSRFVVVVEARPGSGALITGDCALNQGRDVGAVPGPVDRASSMGTNRLIQLGAKPVLEPRDILEEFGITLPERPTPVPPDLSPDEKTVLGFVREGIGVTDELIAALEGTTADLLTIMTGLEVRGLVTRGSEGWRPAAN